MTVAACLAVLGYRFARLPGWRDQRWFWLLAATASMYTGFNVVVTLDAPAWVIELSAHGNWLALSLHVIAWNLHSAAHFHKTPGRVERGLITAAALVGVAALVPGLLLEPSVSTHYFLGVAYHEPPDTSLGSLAALPLYAALFMPMTRFVREARHNRDARRYAAGLLLLAVTTASTTSWRRRAAMSLPYLLDFGFLMMVVLVWSVLMERFTGATHRLDMLSTQLEGIVTERTRELAKAHEALAQAERLAAIGRLSAGVAHEINNPSAAVVVEPDLPQELARDGRRTARRRRRAGRFADVDGQDRAHRAAAARYRARRRLRFVDAQHLRHRTSGRARRADGASRSSIARSSLRWTCPRFSASATS